MKSVAFLKKASYTITEATSLQKDGFRGPTRGPKGGLSEVIVEKYLAGPPQGQGKIKNMK